MKNHGQLICCNKKKKINNCSFEIVNKHRIVFIVILLFTFITFLPFQNIYAFSRLKLTYDNKTVEYTGRQIRVVFDGEDINMNSTPGIVINTSVYVPVVDVFKHGLKANYSYNSQTKTITVRKNGNVVKMTVGSKTAYINNTKTTIEAVPKRVNYVNQNKTQILVPVKFVTEALGYEYEWSDYSPTILISTLTDKEEINGIENPNEVLGEYFSWNLLEEDCNYDETIYSNVIKNISADYTEDFDRIMITGDSSITAKVTMDKKKEYLYVDISGAWNGIGDMIDVLSESYTINYVSVSSREQGTRITIEKTKDSEYFTYYLDNTFFIILKDEMVNDSSLIIPKPKNVKFSSITDEDQYDNNQFVITLPGKHGNFYKKNAITQNNSVIRKTTVKQNKYGNTDITIKTSKLQGYKIYDKGSYFVVFIDNPSKIYKNIVVLDAGHGGRDPGTHGGFTKEKTVNYNILVTYGNKLFNAKNSEIKAYWTRKTDRFIELEDRASFAKKVEADLFISLHMNSVKSSLPKGIEIYYSTANNQLFSSGLTSSKLAAVFDKNLSDNLGLDNRGVKTAKYIVTHRNTVPAILIELGFMSNTSDLKKLRSSSFQKKSANEIYNSTVEIFEKYPTGR